MTALRENSERTSLVAVVGATATGKTRRAVDLAREFNGEVISADSRQVYRRMDIGTGKDLCEYGDVPVHLVDVCEPGDKYNLHRYLRDYNAAVADVRSRGAMPVVCGGSGMYVEAALNGLKLPEVPRNDELRRSLEGKTLDELAIILSDMKSLHNTTDVDTVDRALRAIEIQSYYQAHPDEEYGSKSDPEKNALVIGISIDRDMRRKRIDDRLKSRFETGMTNEVESLLAEGIPAENLIYYGLEYKWLTLYVTGRISRPEMETGLQTAIHQFAKRQMTWFRGMERRGHVIHWLPWDMDQRDFIDAVKALACL
ncbi:MAG: tRNA (adenosine(37)-N6)-dimethylallyltransferase MiaA [Muribaculaceae bacterium]|nr:tRNA (adenosine(37)-N6)-dimethylallyltransferase MiaA [Muribaculaceae bacterium]